MALLDGPEARVKGGALPVDILTANTLKISLYVNEARPGPHFPLHRKTVEIAEIAHHSLIAFSRTDYPDYHEVLAVWFSKAKDKPRIAEEHDSVASLIAAVEAGDGVALLTESMACVASSRLSLTRITPTPNPLVIAAVWPEGKLSAAAELFLSAAKTCAKTTPRS